MNTQRRILLFGLVTLLMAALACSVGGGDDDFQATVDALGELVVQTATAEADEEIDPADLLLTAEASATEVVLTLEAEATARALIPTPTPIPPPPTQAPVPTQDESQVVDPAVAAIEAELASYGIPAGGSLGWIHSPASLSAEGAGLFEAINEFGGPVTENFVVAADIVWGAAAGNSGCGFMLRATTPTFDSSQYFVLLNRQGTGQIQMLPRLEATFIPDEVVTLEAVPADPNFTLQDGSSNRLVVIANGPSLIVISNGAFIGEITPATELGAGGVALAVLSDGGPTNCSFENSWLWLLGSP